MGEEEKIAGKQSKLKGEMAVILKNVVLSQINWQLGNSLQ